MATYIQESPSLRKLVLPSVAEATVKVEDFIDELKTAYQFDEDVYAKIILSVTEAVNNGITHGNKLDPAKSVTVLSTQRDPNELTITVEDEGAGFDYNNLPDPTAPENIEKESGRGVFFIRNYADSVAFNDKGNKIEMNFSLA